MQTLFHVKIFNLFIILSILCCESDNAKKNLLQENIEITTNRNSVVFNADKLRDLFRNHEYTKIIEILEGYNPDEKNSYKYWNLLGSSYMAIKKFIKAEECFRRAVELEGDVYSRYNLGEALFVQGDFGDSTIQYRKVYDSPDVDENLRSITFFKIYLNNLIDSENEKSFVDIPDNINDISTVYCYIAYNIFVKNELHKDLQMLRDSKNIDPSKYIYEDAISEAQNLLR